MEHFTSATRIINEIQESLFPRLESCRDAANVTAIEGAIDERVKQVETIVDRLEIAVNKATPAQRSSLKFKLDQLRQEHRHLLTSFHTIHQRRLTREREQRERDELLHRRFTTNEAARTDTEINIGATEYFDDEKTRLHGAHRNIDDMLAQGAAVISNLRDQRANLQSIRTRILDVLGTLGLSNSVMRLIEKRALTDKYILFGLMFIFTVLMFLIWKYLT